MYSIKNNMIFLGETPGGKPLQNYKNPRLFPMTNFSCFIVRIRHTPSNDVAVFGKCYLKRM